MKVSEALRAMTTGPNANVKRIDLDERQQYISCYGPVVAIARTSDYRRIPFKVLIEDGPDEFYWVNIETMPDWLECLSAMFHVMVRTAKKVYC